MKRLALALIIGPCLSLFAILAGSFLLASYQRWGDAVPTLGLIGAVALTLAVYRAIPE